LAVALLLAVSCSKNIQNPDAVKQGVLDYLNEKAPSMGLNMSAMEVTVSSVSFEKDLARASVSFHPKGSPADGGMQMSYVMERKGDKWTVKGRQASQTNQHGNEALPEGAPQGTPGGELPPGHPPTGGAGAAQGLPPGHPPTASKQ
jgi:hypothetical protein